MENTAKDTIEHWFPGSQYDGQACDPKDLYGPRFDVKDALLSYCGREIAGWLDRDEGDRPPVIAASICFRGESMVVVAKVRKETEFIFQGFSE